MADPNFPQLVTQARTEIQAARNTLNEALSMPESDQLPWKTRQLLTNTRTALSRHLTVTRKVLLSLDEIFHQDETLPGFLVSPEGIGTRNWKPTKSAIEDAGQTEQTG